MRRRISPAISAVISCPVQSSLPMTIGSGDSGTVAAPAGVMAARRASDRACAAARVLWKCQAIVVVLPWFYRLGNEAIAGIAAGVARRRHDMACLRQIRTAPRWLRESDEEDLERRAARSFPRLAMPDPADCRAPARRAADAGHAARRLEPQGRPSQRADDRSADQTGCCGIDRLFPPSAAAHPRTCRGARRGACLPRRRLLSGSPFLF